MLSFRAFVPIRTLELMQEIVQIYPQLAQPPTLTATASNRVCNSLALLQCAEPSDGVFTVTGESAAMCSDVCL